MEGHLKVAHYEVVGSRFFQSDPSRKRSEVVCQIF
jgi:hypothetical protein